MPGKKNIQTPAEIKSRDNPRLKRIMALRRSARRRTEGLVVVEGEKEIALALAAGWRAAEIYYAPALTTGREKADAWPKRHLTSVDDKLFKKISYRENPDGFLALVEPRRLRPGEIEPGPEPLVIILDSVEKPGNLGAVLRSADAAGAAAVLCTDQRTDIYNPNVIRASLGAVFTVPVAIGGFAEVLSWLKRYRIRIIAATPQAKAVYYRANLSGPLAIVIGSEHEGLSGRWLEAADQSVRIPLAGRVDSLNASVSAAVLMFEALRQRRAARPSARPDS